MELCWINQVCVPAALPAGLSFFLNKQGKKMRKSSGEDKDKEATHQLYGQNRLYLGKNYFNLLSVKRELDSVKERKIKPAPLFPFFSGSTSLLDPQFLFLMIGPGGWIMGAVIHP